MNSARKTTIEKPSAFASSNEAPSTEPAPERPRVRRVALHTGIRAGMGVDGTHNI